MAKYMALEKRLRATPLARPMGIAVIGCGWAGESHAQARVMVAYKSMRWGQPVRL